MTVIGYRLTFCDQRALSFQLFNCHSAFVLNDITTPNHVLVQREKKTFS